jgi:hypothetical protein
MARVSPTMRRAQPRTRSPSGVKPWNGLRDAARLGGAAEMFFACERQQKIELVDHIGHH